jgi:hypothetical protein
MVSAHTSAWHEASPDRVFVLVRGLVVGVGGLEPPASSVSVDPRVALCGAGSLQVAADRKVGSKAVTHVGVGRSRMAASVNRPSNA